MTSKHTLLDELINSSAKNELDCRRFLFNARVIPYLCRGIPTKIIRYVEEDRGFFGDTDFTLSVEEHDGTGSACSACYIWELKAPQCFIYEADDNRNRLRPTIDLIKAENQILHYTYEAQKNQLFWDRFKILSADNIYPGGVIIGPRKTKFRGSFSDSDRDHLFSLSNDVRKKYFYKPSCIKILIWDQIVEWLKADRSIGIAHCPP